MVSLQVKTYTLQTSLEYPVDDGEQKMEQAFLKDSLQIKPGG